MLARRDFAFSIAEHECSMLRQVRVLLSGRMVAILAYLFYGLVDNISSGCDLFLLTDSVHTVHCLVLYHGIPLRLHEEDMVCSG